ncbi:hypothetical protein CAAN1_10S01442 [[Candida] anglica]|uniref:Glycoside hydrolase family 5 domain-containing protein n=1 Tax=[Candida] anglica TaxID=148631 RepID=A0ABP0EEA2_9ASCO
MFDKLKIKSKSSNIAPANPAATPGSGPSKKQIYQSRSNFGVNLGGCFVLEKWIFHKMFPEGTDCELDAVTKLVKDSNTDETKKKFEEYWSGFMSEDDWKWLQEHKVTSVRVPLGYWDVNGGKYAKGTKFEKYATTVYSNAWDIFKKKFIEPAAAHNISVVVDIHGLPGGANGADHSGEKSSGKAEFWSDQSAQLTMCDMFEFIAKDLKSYDNIAGLQIVNEAEFANDPAKEQSRFYGAALSHIRKEDKDIPVIISDGWWPGQWAKWVQSNQSGNESIGVVVDSHCYRCFSDDDKKKSPPQIIQDLDSDLLTNIDRNGVDFMVGEYSCVIDGESWNKDNANSKRDELVVDYGKRQSEIIGRRAGFGSYFWTFKFESGNGGEWDFKTMVDKGAIVPTTILNGVPDSSKFDEKLEGNLSAHSDYWNGQNSNEKYEHDRYKDGFTTAWKDSEEFAKFNGSTIGREQAWKLARRAEHIKQKGDSKYIWEWEQGFDKGLEEFLG